MFQGCFSYDKKGLCHIWQAETPREKKEARREINAWNQTNHNRLYAKWKIKLNVRQLRVDGTKLQGRTPQQRFNKENRKRVCKAAAGDVDWWRYGKEILTKKLIPFAKKV